MAQKKVTGSEEPESAGPEHQAVADEEETDGTQGKVNHVLHDHVAGVLGPGEPHLH